MNTDALSLFPSILETQLSEGWLWGILGIIIAIIVGYWWYKKTKTDIDQSRKYIEECIEKRIHAVEYQVEPTRAYCKKVEEEAKRLHDATSNYDRGLVKRH